MARFSNASDEYSYDVENQSIKDILKTTSNFRLGAEFRVNNNIYLRGGYAYYGKAFGSAELNNNLSYNSISFGVGFRIQTFFLDLAFTSMSDTQKYLMYYLTEPNPATINTTKNSFTATLGYKF
jgi:long-subunit fatty acid transport protein